ncbi:hypothetical protein STEG23_030689, partial [Scotinomys teguina]
HYVASIDSHITSKMGFYDLHLTNGSGTEVKETPRFHSQKTNTGRLKGNYSDSRYNALFTMSSIALMEELTSTTIGKQTSSFWALKRRGPLDPTAAQKGLYRKPISDIISRVAAYSTEPIRSVFHEGRKNKILNSHGYSVAGVEKGHGEACDMDC